MPISLPPSRNTQPFAVQNAQLVSSLQQELVQRVESGARLEASELRYRSMFEGSPVPLWVIDRESHRFLAVNEAAIDAYGYSHDEFLAMTIFDIRPASEYEKLRIALQQVGPGVRHSGTFTHRRKDGSHLSVEVDSHDVDFDGRPARMVQARDITERVRAFEALRISEERHRLSPASPRRPSGSGIRPRASCNGTRRSTTCSSTPRARWSSRWPGSRRASTPRTVTAPAHCSPRPCARSTSTARAASVSSAVTDRTPRSRGVPSSPGSTAWRSASSAPSPTSPSSSRWASSSQSPSAWRRSGRLAGGVAHDFNNLLTAIRGFASFAMDEQLPPVARARISTRSCRPPTAPPR
ncbi:MAG: PAS domain S-box protein [Gemmatimonadetes bacterium]|nr:PAS domain S-box protein [Gemmatimonadota bacterium]